MSFTPKDATCVVEQLWPGINVDLATAQLQRVIHAASALSPAGRPRVLGATLIPEDETLFTWCVAPSIDSVRNLLVASGIRFDRVLPVIHAQQRRSPVHVVGREAQGRFKGAIGTAKPAKRGRAD